MTSIGASCRAAPQRSDQPLCRRKPAARGKRHASGIGDRRPVGKRIAEWHAHLEDVGTCGQRGLGSGLSIGLGWVARQDVGDERRAALGRGRIERRADALPTVHGVGQLALEDAQILVAAPGQVDQDMRIGRKLRQHCKDSRHGVGGLERRDDPAGARQPLGRLERLGVRCPPHLEPARLGERRQLRSDTGIVEPGADRVRLDDLPGGILGEHRERPVQHARRTEAQRGGVVAERVAATAGLHADQARGGVEERPHDPDRVASAADAGDDRVRHAPDGSSSSASAPRAR